MLGTERLYRKARISGSGGQSESHFLAITSGSSAQRPIWRRRPQNRLHKNVTGFAAQGEDFGFLNCLCRGLLGASDNKLRDRCSAQGGCASNEPFLLRSNSCFEPILFWEPSANRDVLFHRSLTLPECTASCRTSQIRACSRFAISTDSRALFRRTMAAPRRGRRRKLEFKGRTAKRDAYANGRQGYALCERLKPHSQEWLCHPGKPKAIMAL